MLDLEGNSFQGIPEALRSAQRLTHLDLSCNHGLQIGLPDVRILLQLHALRVLDLSKVSERLPLDGPPAQNEVSTLFHAAAYALSILNAATPRATDRGCRTCTSYCSCTRCGC